MNFSSTTMKRFLWVRGVTLWAQLLGPKAGLLAAGLAVRGGREGSWQAWVQFPGSPAQPTQFAHLLFTLPWTYLSALWIRKGLYRTWRDGTGEGTRSGGDPAAREKPFSLVWDFGEGGRLGAELGTALEPGSKGVSAGELCSGLWSATSRLQTYLPHLKNSLQLKLGLPTLQKAV